MMILSSKELLKKYKGKIKSLVPDEEFIVAELIALRSAIIDSIDSLTDDELQEFLKIDSDFINLLPEIYSCEDNFDIKDAVNNGSYKIYNEMQLRKLVA